MVSNLLHCDPWTSNGRVAHIEETVPKVNRYLPDVSVRRLDQGLGSVENLSCLNGSFRSFFCRYLRQVLPESVGTGNRYAIRPGR